MPLLLVSLLTDLTRLALYFPVSALMTLFGNILQNPLDPRARSDTKLMGIVVTFLSTLGQEAETGGVHRMLGVCAEFERIAKMIIEKTEKEGSKRKRRTQDPPKPINPTAAAQISTTPRPSSQQATPTPHYNQHQQPSVSQPMSSPGMRRSQTPQSGSNYHSPMNTGSSGNGQAPRDGPNAWPQDYPSTGPIYDTPDFNNFHDLTGFGQPIASPPMQNPNAPPAFTPALLPQDIWQLPMSLDWDWAEFSGGAYPSFENGSTMPNGNGL